MAEITAQAVQQLREKTGLGMMQCKKALAESDGDPEKAVELLRKQGAAVAAKRVGKETKEGKVLVASAAGALAAVEINCETDFVANSGDFKAFADKIVQVLLTQRPRDPEALRSLHVDGQPVSELLNAVIGKIGENISIRRFVVEPVGAQELGETYSHMQGKIGVLVKLAFSGEPKDRAALTTLARDLAMQVAAASPLAIDAQGVPADVVAKEREIYRELTLQEGKTGDVVDKIVEGKVAKFYKENCLLNQVFVKDSKTTIDKLLAANAKSLGLASLEVRAFHRLQLGQ